LFSSDSALQMYVAAHLESMVILEIMIFRDGPSSNLSFWEPFGT